MYVLGVRSHFPDGSSLRFNERMRNKSWHWASICVAAAWFSAVAFAEPRIEVAALFEGAAVLEVDGVSKLVKAGRSFGGVRLVSADSRAAVIEIDGKEHTLALSGRIAGAYSSPKSVSVSLTLSSGGQYRSQGTINGHPAAFIVDTGATVVALSETQAKAMAIDYQSGQKSRAITAGGPVDAWRVQLSEVSVGAITVLNVDALVLQGSSPPNVLLGMTFLRNVEISEKDGVMVLISEFQ